MDAIIIYDSEPILLERLKKSLEANYDVYCCSNREDFLLLAAELQPLVLVVDLSFAGEDTVSVLQSLYMSGYRTHIVASGNFYSPYLINRLEQLQVHSFLTRPCEINLILRSILDAACADHYKHADVKRFTHDLLLSLGFRMDLSGYHYVFDALIYTIEHPDSGLISQLYPDIAKPYHASSKNAEKAIRDCITSAWKNRDRHIWKRYFPNDYHKEKPVSNGVFFKRMAYAIEDFMGFVQQKTGTDE